MSKAKWGESFLKTGVPFEHLTLMTLNSAGWLCELHHEYRRPSFKDEDRTFEIDLVALQRLGHRPGLCLIIECKYHDEERFWFFLPSINADHLSSFGLGSSENLEADERVLFFVPLNPLAGEPSSSMLPLAPKSFWGTVVSRTGQKQENTVHAALSQVAYAMAPIALDLFDAPAPTAILPVVVTSAKLYRLRPGVVDLNIIREARAPSDIADELPWTWCYQAMDDGLSLHNLLAARKRFKKGLFSDMHEVDKQLGDIYKFPRWVAVINISHLAGTLEQISKCFDGLPMKDAARECIDVAERVWRHDFPEP